MADVALIAGFVLASVGVYLVAGAGWACLVSGLVLFVAGGFSGRSAKR